MKNVNCNYWLRACISVLLLTIGLQAHAGNLTASVDRDALGLEETFTLTLRYDEQINAAPDYELLQKDFEILNTQSGTQMSIINGSMEASTEWKIALAPRRIGKLLIPSFNIDGAVSDAIEITVDGNKRSPKDANNNVSVEIETSKDSGYVQEQIIVTLRLYTTVGLSGVELEPLKVKDALVMQLDEKQYQTKINGRPGAVVETRYAIFPQQSGELLIPGLLYQVAVDGGRRDLWDRFYGNGQNNVLRLRTDEQKLTINPAPAAADGHPWMPAGKVTLEQHWSADTNNLKVGEPITRTITIKAEGLTAGQINPLQIPSVDGITFYNDQAQNDDQKATNGITGSRTETIAIVPTREGVFTLPETTLYWWDTHSQSLQTAHLNAVNLSVGSGAASQQNVTAIPDTTAEEAQAPAPVIADKTPGDIAAEKPLVVNKVPLWLYITNALSLLLAIFFAVKYWQNKRLTAIDERRQPTITELHPNEGDAWNNLKRQLADKSLTGLRKAIVDWAQAFWRSPSITSLHAVAARAQITELTHELRELDEAIFGSGNAIPDLDNLLQLLANLRRSKSDHATGNGDLKPLYPT